MYNFWALQPIPQKRQKQYTYWAPKGLQNVIAVEFQNMETCQVCENYFPEQNGKLVKSKGYTTLKLLTGIWAWKVLKKYSSDILVYWFGTTIWIYTISTDIQTNLKTNFTTSWVLESVKYREFLYTANGNVWNKIVVSCLDTAKVFVEFTWWTGTAFAVWQTITDVSTTKTWVIDKITLVSWTFWAWTAAWVMLLSSVNGTFDWWALSSSWWWSSTGSTYHWANYEISQAPKATAIHEFQWRLFAWNTDTATDEIKWCKQDTVFTEIPFLIWTTTNNPLTATDPASTSFWWAWTVKSITNIGTQIVAFYEDWKSWIRISTIDVYNLWLWQVTQIDFSKLDFWWERGAIITPVWIFYLNEGWLWQMLSWWLDAQPFWENEANITKQVFPQSYVDTLDFTDADIVYDPISKRIYITCREDSQTNNLIIWYDTVNKSFWKRTNMQIARFLLDWWTIYWISSLEPRIYKLFDWYEDDWISITARFEQSIKLPLNTLHELKRTEIKGFLHSDSNIEINYDIYDKFWDKITDFFDTSFTFSNSTINMSMHWYNETWYWEGNYWSSISNPYDIESLWTNTTKIDEFTRLIFKISSIDKVPHEITWAWLEIETKSENPTDINLS
mgnify:CR=1 FL=1